MLLYSTTPLHVPRHYSSNPSPSMRTPHLQHLVDLVFWQLRMGLPSVRGRIPRERAEYSMVRIESMRGLSRLNWRSTLYGLVLATEEVDVRQREIRRNRLREGCEDLLSTWILYVTFRQSLLLDRQRRHWWWESPSYVPEWVLDRYAALRPSRLSRGMRMDLSILSMKILNGCVISGLSW